MPLQYYSFFDPSSGTVRYFNEIISQLGSAPLLAGTTISMVIALACCFFGFRLARLIMTVSGFIAGCLLGFSFLAPLAGGSEPVTLLITLACGSILAALSWFIYKAGIFILALVLAFSASQVLIPFDGIPKLILCLLLGLAAAILVSSFIKPGIIGITAIYGGSHAAPGLLSLLSFFHLTLPDILQNRILFSALLAGFGFLVQWVSTRSMDN